MEPYRETRLDDNMACQLCGGRAALIDAAHNQEHISGHYTYRRSPGARHRYAGDVGFRFHRGDFGTRQVHFFPPRQKPRRNCFGIRPMVKAPEPSREVFQELRRRKPGQQDAGSIKCN